MMSEINSPAVGITEEMIMAGADVIDPTHAFASTKRTVREVLEAALAGRTGTAPPIDWSVVEATVRQAVTDWALAYWIPANGLCSGVREHQEKLASKWAEGSSPFITARIREALRKAASGSSKGGDPKS